MLDGVGCGARTLPEVVHGQVQFSEKGDAAQMRKMRKSSGQAAGRYHIAERFSYISAAREAFLAADVLSVVADAVRVGADDWLNVFVYNHWSGKTWMCPPQAGARVDIRARHLHSVDALERFLGAHFCSPELRPHPFCYPVPRLRAHPFLSAVSQTSIFTSASLLLPLRAHPFFFCSVPKKNRKHMVLLFVVSSCHRPRISTSYARIPSLRALRSHPFSSWGLFLRSHPFFSRVRCLLLGAVFATLASLLFVRFSFDVILRTGNVRRKLVLPYPT